MKAEVQTIKDRAIAHVQEKDKERQAREMERNIERLGKLVDDAQSHIKRMLPELNELELEWLPMDGYRAHEEEPKTVKARLDNEITLAFSHYFRSAISGGGWQRNVNLVLPCSDCSKPDVLHETTIHNFYQLGELLMKDDLKAQCQECFLKAENMAGRKPIAAEVSVSFPMSSAQAKLIDAIQAMIWEQIPREM